MSIVGLTILVLLIVSVWYALKDFRTERNMDYNAYLRKQINYYADKNPLPMDINNVDQLSFTNYIKLGVEGAMVSTWPIPSDQVQKLVRDYRKIELLKKKVDTKPEFAVLLGIEGDKIREGGPVIGFGYHRDGLVFFGNRQYLVNEAFKARLNNILWPRIAITSVKNNFYQAYYSLDLSQLKSFVAPELFGEISGEVRNNKPRVVKSANYKMQSAVTGERDGKTYTVFTYEERVYFVGGGSQQVAIDLAFQPGKAYPTVVGFRQLGNKR